MSDVQPAQESDTDRRIGAAETPTQPMPTIESRRAPGPAFEPTSWAPTMARVAPGSAASPPVADMPSPSDPYRPLDTGAPASTHPAASGRGRRVVAGAAAAVALVAAGVGIGSRVGGDDAPTMLGGPVGTTESTVAPGSGVGPGGSVPDPAPSVDGDTEVDPTVEPVAAVAAAVSPSVVRIDTVTPAGGGTGSGIIYDETGLVVTNAHVAVGATQVVVQLSDGTRVEGSVVGLDPAVDVAVLQIDPSGLDIVPAAFADSASIEVGQMAVAIGSPFGLEQSVTAGIISAVNRVVENVNVVDGSPTVVEMLQTDAPINPGNSGGALADREGRVVGMNTSIRTDGTVQGNLGVGFAIPAETLRLIADRIISGDDLSSGFLGVSGTDPTTGPAGALITEVVSGGPAESAGLQAGDLIVSIDGARVRNMADLAAHIRLSSPGTSVTMQVDRGEDEVEIDVVLGTLGG